LLYVKSCRLSDLPIDLAAYATQERSFPHDSTGRQWFSEAQFESYRALGEISMVRALEQLNDKPSHQIGKSILDRLNSEN
jgi:hypothetical protein